MPALNTNDYAYIIPPSAQFRDLNGEPYSAGFVEFYKHGTSEKYITYADWAGSFNPFRIPLNSQGRGIAIAEKDVILDMYVYNYLGNLAYSRLNVRTTEDQDGAPLRFTSSDGSIVITRTDNIVDLKVFHDEKIFGSAEADSVGDNGLIEFDDVNSGDITVVSAGTIRIGAGKLYHVTVALEFNTGTINPLYCDCQLVDSEHTVHKFTLDASRTKQMIELSWDAVSSSDTFQLFIQAPSIFTVTSAELYIHSVNPVVGGSTPQLQSDWNVTDIDSPAYIKNKPDLSIYAQLADLAEVAFSGDYDDLANKPDLSVFARSADLATVATTGSYNDLTNVPAHLVQDADYVHTDNNFTDALKNKLDGLPADTSIYTPHAAVCQDWVANTAIGAGTIRWDDGKAYQAKVGIRAQNNTVAPHSAPTYWEEIYIAEVGQDVYHYFNSYHNGKPTITRSELLRYFMSGKTVYLVDTNNNQGGTSPWLYPGDVFYPLYFCSNGNGSFKFAHVEADGSGIAIWTSPTTRSSSVWTKSSKSFGKIYQAGQGISITGTNNNVINCTLDPFPAHTSANADNFITVNAQNQLIWKALAAVALSGSYNDLSNKPTIPPAQVQSDWDETDDTKKSFILNKPNAIPLVAGTDISIVEVDNQLVVSYTGSGSGTGVDDVTVNGSSVLNANHVAVIDLSPYVLASALATVATSGSYADLSNKPDLSVYALASSLAAVATSGDYNDLSNKPTIPTITYTTSQEVTDILADLT